MDVPIALRLRPKAWQITIVAIIASLAVGTAYLLRSKIDAPLYMASDEIVSRLNTFGKRLAPGEEGVVEVDAENVDELILLGAFCSHDELRRSLPTATEQLVLRLAQLSKDDRLCPALVWLRNGQIVTVRRANFVVGIELTVRTWKVKGSVQIRVRKQTQSPNSFLSLEFI